MSRALKQRRIATRLEQEIAEDLGGRRTFLSGAGFDKADVRKRAGYTRDETGQIQRTKDLAFRVEAKTTSLSHYNFTQQNWTTLSRVADRAGEHPLFVIRFLDIGFTLAILRRDLAKELGLGCPDYILSMIKSCRLDHRYPTTIHLKLYDHRGRFRNEELWVVRYREFLDKLHAYETDQKR